MTWESLAQFHVFALGSLPFAAAATLLNAWVASRFSRPVVIVGLVLQCVLLPLVIAGGPGGGAAEPFALAIASPLSWLCLWVAPATALFGASIARRPMRHLVLVGLIALLSGVSVLLLGIVLRGPSAWAM